jgi:hypothetical protein
MVGQLRSVAEHRHHDPRALTVADSTNQPSPISAAPTPEARTAAPENQAGAPAAQAARADPKLTAEPRLVRYDRSDGPVSGPVVGEDK